MTTLHPSEASMTATARTHRASSSALVRDRLADTSARTSLRDTVSHTMSLAWRAAVKLRRNPEQLFDVVIQPIVFTTMFAWIFGGAISGDVAGYLPLMVPGILAQTALTTSMATGVQMRQDMDTGVFDRFRSLPMARIAPLAGPMVADLIRYFMAAVLTFATGIAIGYRPGGGAVGVGAAVLLIVVTGWSLAWIFTWLGTVVQSARTVQGYSMMILFPLTFLSNAFVPAETMPGWLEAFVGVNPVSHVVSATRDLANEAALTSEVGWALLGSALVVAIFAPLAVRSYQRSL